MNHKNGSSPQGYGVYFKEIAYICHQDIYYATRNRIDLFSRVKSGKFFEDENKSTLPNHTIMAWAVAYFGPPVYQSLHDKMSLQLAPLLLSHNRNAMSSIWCNAVYGDSSQDT